MPYARKDFMYGMSARLKALADHFCTFQSPGTKNNKYTIEDLPVVAYSVFRTGRDCFGIVFDQVSRKGD